MPKASGGEGSDLYEIAHTIALNALVARAKSKGELLAHLKLRGVEDDIAQAVIFRLQESGLVNDRDFASAWANSRHSHKKLSKRIIAGELRQKGIKSVLAILSSMRPGAVDEDYVKCMRNKGYTVEK